MTSSPPGLARPWSPAANYPSRPTTPSHSRSPPRSVPPSPSLQPERLERSRAEQSLLSLLEREQSLLTVLENEQKRAGKPRRRQRSVTISDVDRSASPTRPSTPVFDPRLSTNPVHAMDSKPGKKRSIGESLWKEHGYHPSHGHHIRARNVSGTSLKSIASIDSLPDVDLVSLVERSIALRNPQQRLAPHFSTSPVLRAVDAGVGATTSPGTSTGGTPKIGIQTPSLKSSTSSVKGGAASGKLRASTPATQNSPPKRPPTPRKVSPRPTATHQRSSSAIPKTLERPILPHRAASDAMTGATSRSLPSGSGGMSMARQPSQSGQSRADHLDPSPKLGPRQRSKQSPAASSVISSPLSSGSANDEPSPPSFDLNDGGILTPCTCRTSYFADKRAPAICTCSASRPGRPTPGLGSGGPSGVGITQRSASASASTSSSPPLSAGGSASSGSGKTVRPVPISATATCMSSDEGGPVLMPKTSGSLQSAWSAERASRKLKQQEGRVCFDEVLGIPEDKRGSGRRWSLW